MRNIVFYAALTIGFCISLCAPDAYAQQQIRIQDDQGAPVVNAEVMIDCSGIRRQGFADTGGIFAFGPINGPTQCALAISSVRTETHAGVLDIPADGKVSRVIVVTRKRVWVVQVTVVDEGTKMPVGNVEVGFDCGSDRWNRTTNGSGVAELERIIAARQCTITTDHKSYEPLTKVIEVPTGMFEPVRHQVAIKRKINIKTVRVTVIDSNTDEPIQDARVSLVGRLYSSFGGTTGVSGVANIEIDRAGQFQIEVTQDNYYPAKSTIFVEAGAAEESLTATVSLAKKRDQSGVPVAVTVKGKRLDGTIVDLQNAIVKAAGSDGSVTGPDGRTIVRLPGYVGDSVDITATATGYEPQSRSLSVPRFGSVIVAPELTFILTEKKPAVTGIRLIIEVTDRKDGSPVAGATVALAGKAGTSNSVTDARGYVQFIISSDAIKSEQYLRYTVKKEGYVEKWSDVSAELLKPSDEPRYYSIQMEKSVANGDSIFWGTWHGVGNAKGITMTINADYTMTYIDTRPGYEKSGKGGWGRDTSRVDFIATAIGYGFWYNKDGRLSDPWGNFYVK